jgi:polar amino acid transport system permease protein
VQIFGAFFLLPAFGIELTPFWVGVIALTFNSAGYQIEIARSAIESIDRGQREGGLALGLEAWEVQWLIILPQALRRMVPPLTNELSQVVKASSVLSVISVFELHKASNALASTSFKYIEVLTLQAALYFIVIHGLSLLSRHLEHRLPGGQSLDAAAAVR